VPLFFQQIFNSGMDALLAQQGEWRISATGLREQLGQQLVNKISPVFTEFYNSFASVKFSKKHSEQYLRFSPTVVEKNLQNFFGKN
jgi:hypothetical protein